MLSIGPFAAPACGPPEAVAAEAHRRANQVLLDRSALAKETGLVALWAALQAHARADRLSYEAYAAVRAACGASPGCAPLAALLSAAAFLQLPRDAAGTVSAKELYVYADLRVTWQQARGSVRPATRNGPRLRQRTHPPRRPSIARCAATCASTTPSAAGRWAGPRWAPLWARCCRERCAAWRPTPPPSTAASPPAASPSSWTPGGGGG